MFDQKEYRETFSQVTASRRTRQEVMNMMNNRKASSSGRTVFRTVVLAALVCALAVTAAASETVRSWFVSFFAESTDGELSQGQVTYIADNAHVILDSQSHDDWTVELLSAMNDHATGYILLRITGPDGVDMTHYIFGNQGVRGHFAGLPDMITPPENTRWYSWGWAWLDDQDGKDNTRNLMIHMNPNTKDTKVKPFSENQKFTLSLINIVREFEDEDYRRELEAGKKADENLSSFTKEETLKLYQHEVIAEGTWEFQIIFEDLSDDCGTVDILSEPITTKACFMRDLPGGEIDDFEFVTEEVLLTKIEMDHLTVSFHFADCEGIPDPVLTDGDEAVYPYVVMRDGNRIRLVPYGSDGSLTMNLLAEAPLVYDEIDHILLADGTVVAMPE